MRRKPLQEPDPKQAKAALGAFEKGIQNCLRKTGNEKKTVGKDQPPFPLSESFVAPSQLGFITRRDTSVRTTGGLACIYSSHWERSMTRFRDKIAR
jgi:hypothetical protein